MSHARLAAALALVLTTVACASGSSAIRSSDFQTRIAASATSTPTAPALATTLTLASDLAAYRAGEAVSLALVNTGMTTYGLATSGESCATPTAVWLRDERGDTYFVRSGVHNSCEDSKPIAPGTSASLVTFDTDVVWFDRSSDETLYRLPRSLPIGAYSVHALTPIGELVTTLEITPR